MSIVDFFLPSNEGSAFGTRSRFVSSDARGPSNFDNEQDAGVEALSTFTVNRWWQFTTAGFTQDIL
jgi:hypothetical protein